ncbi:hypothetical protein AUR64_10800 [Haloprofundus marisrubri]|uniref:Uncharacterized protein n=1 Tax=Haloprofundus marisrubri TaxID=1514971 RepID=A0A0W1R9P6_9EURY|nr:hypothetical protein [Haloprofundus marisrubri]KTG10078.1 hypothetical protein AUR64_10800 [Haloprofundus marisrubri]
MNRRGVIAGAATGTAALLGVGALGLQSDDEDTSNHEFERRRPEDDEHAAERPSVTFEPQQTRLRVTGALVVGSDSCLRASLASATYDADAGRLDVAVAAERDDSLDGCDGTETPTDTVVTGDTDGENDSFSANWSANDSNPQKVPDYLTVDGYDAVFEFDDGMPGLVVVTERDEVYGERTTRVEWALG